MLDALRRWLQTADWIGTVPPIAIGVLLLLICFVLVFRAAALGQL